MLKAIEYEILRDVKASGLAKIPLARHRSALGMGISAVAWMDHIDRDVLAPIRISRGHVATLRFRTLSLTTETGRN